MKSADLAGDRTLASVAARAAIPQNREKFLIATTPDFDDGFITVQA
jgi:hypothetical protein